MDVLKKVSSATLLETLVASAIILTAFVIGSISINNIFLSTVKNDTEDFDNHLRELQYKSIHNTISFPYYEDTEKWDISIQKTKNIISVTALNKNNEAETKKKLISE